MTLRVTFVSERTTIAAASRTSGSSSASESRLSSTVTLNSGRCCNRAIPFGETGSQINTFINRGRTLVWCLPNSYTFVALKLAWGNARGRECIRSDTRPTEQRSPRPISAQPEGQHVFWAEALLLAPHRSTAGYARRSRGSTGARRSPGLRPKSSAANVWSFRRHHTTRTRLKAGQILKTRRRHIGKRIHFWSRQRRTVSASLAGGYGFCKKLYPSRKRKLVSRTSG